jgi:formate-dependent nitrite reductase membrane component NrfD
MQFFPGSALLAILLAAGATGYSAFLFGQAEGRDFWQSPLLVFQLIFAAVLAGAATLILLPLLDAIQSPRNDPVEILKLFFFFGLFGHGLVVLLEVLNRHPTHEAARAARYISHGPGRLPFWIGIVAMGTIVPLAICFGDPSPAMLNLAAVLALAGLWLWEHLWVKAGQSVPLS